MFKRMTREDTAEIAAIDVRVWLDELYTRE